MGLRFSMVDAAPGLESLSDPARVPEQQRFTRHALSVFGFTLAVILFGAVVRITGSGAGCGQHWPSCQGEIVHLPRKLETAIEYTHRVSSGLSALFVWWLAVRAFRVFRRADPVRTATLVASAMMIVEALLGRALVMFGLVGQNASIGRAVIMSLHLLSTSILTASLALAAWWSLPRAPQTPARELTLSRATLACALWLLIVSASGAVTALGDTLYPVHAGAFADRLVELQSPAAHFLERLRVVHPLFAVLGAVACFALASRASDRRLSRATRLFSRAVLLLASLQVMAGSLNVLLSAPGWLQVVHLLLATLLWVALVLLKTELWSPRTAR